LAEDLCQEAFIKVFRFLDSYDSRRKFSSWVFKIAHNTAIDHLRRSSPHLVPLEGGEEGDVAPADTVSDPGAESPERAAQRAGLGRALEAAIGDLRAEYRSVVLLRYNEGLSYQEVAEITGQALGTVKTNLHRARKELAAALRDLGWEPEP
jgi:RNA polymerase sigma-70 factor (ECF subfamily)